MTNFISLISVLITILGLFGAWVYGRKTKKFRWSEYVAMLIGPSIGAALFVYMHGQPFLHFFLASCIVGWLAEAILGFAYHKILGQKFWIYKEYPVLNGYVSILTFPFWGFAGALFFKLALMFDIL
jgi:uncharacterized membrane protein